VEVVEWADQVLGLDLVNKFKLFSQEEKALFDQRKFAREASDFGKADQIRAQLSELGIESEDIGVQTLYWRNS
jgi:cysteinyl-tRNA synthetase